MLTVPSAKVPRKVLIKVARAENLQESSKDEKKKTKFKISVIGGKKKEHSSVENGINGNVQWSFNCTIKLNKSQTDPICILVEDSDGNHKGQVVIPIVKIPPKPYTFSNNQDGATSNNILCSELEPTNKCSDPRGFLLYWIWVEEYYIEEHGDSGKRSFNKSMSSLFGSKSRLSGSSKVNLDVKNSDTLNNKYGSVSNLEKSEKHKKVPSILKIKIGKKKPKPSVSEAKVTPESSDIDSLSNFSLNHGNPFEEDVNWMRNDMKISASNSLSGMEIFTPQQLVIKKNPFNDENPSLKSDIKITSIDTYHHPDNYSNGKSGESDPYIANKSLPKLKTGDSSQNSTLDNNSVPRQAYVNKYNTLNLQDLSMHKDRPIIVETPPSPFLAISENDHSFAPGHNKSSIGSDFSFSNEKLLFRTPSVGVNKTTHYDESETVKKENSELKAQNTKYNQQITDLQNELDSVKKTLCNLRMKLLEEGATTFLEIG